VVGQASSIHGHVPFAIQLAIDMRDYSGREDLTDKKSEEKDPEPE